MAMYGALPTSAQPIGWRSVPVILCDDFVANARLCLAYARSGPLFILCEDGTLCAMLGPLPIR